MNLEKVTSRIPNNLIYRFLNTYLGRRIYKLHLQHTRTVTVRSDGLFFEMEVPSNRVHWWDDFDKGDCHEWVTTKSFSQKLEKVDRPVVWDIGSKFGYFMMVASNYTPPENIHVFEADPAHASVISLNNRRYLDEKATVNTNRVTDRAKNEEISGDRYLRSHDCPDLIKIDVDGPEADVVAGMSRTIAGCSPDLLIEIHHDNDVIGKLIRIDSVLPDDRYEYYICMNHRATDGEWDHILDLTQIREIENDLLLRCSRI